MRKIIISLLLLCMHFSTRGQTPYEYRYWFDGDISTAVTGSTTSDAWRMEIDLSRLKESFHTIHLQVTDEKGVSSSPATRCFFLLREGGALTNGYYWFDNEVQTRNVRGDVQGSLTFDVSELQEGFHTIHYQVLREDGLYSQIETRSFYKMQSDQIVGELTFMCYIDGKDFKQERVSVENGAAVWFLDVSELPIGFHKLQVKAIMQNGASTTNREAFFLREAMPSELNAMTCVCSIDGKVFRQEMMQTANGTGLWQIDVSELPIGFHRLQLRAVMQNGASTSIREAFFLRSAMDAEMEALSCVFSIDGKPYKTIESGVHEGVFHCELDVAGLSDGLHKIAYMFTNGKGAQTNIKSQYFVKTPVGGNSIKMYQYWINDNDDMAHTVEQTEVTDPLKLITLLPVEPQPIRSSLFHFGTKSGKPMMYAKNEIHLRFYDNSGRWVDASDQYIDYAFGKEVKPVGKLQATQTFDKIAENDVRWYTIEAYKGEYLEFKTDKACSLQLFSPNGEEVYYASGSNAVKWGGRHALQDGIYYFAVHDITAQQGSTISLDYKLTNKYAVLHHTPDVVGNAKGSYFTMHLKGNGFDKLMNATLNQGSQIICKDSILAASSFKTDIRFYINADIEGIYDLILSFVDEEGEESTLTVKDAISFEEAYYADVKVEMINKSSFRPYPLSVKVKNEGNMSYSYIPLNIAWDNPQLANDVTFNNFYATVAEANDSAGYQPIVCTNNLLGKGVDGVVMFFYIPELGPYETMELQFGFSAPGHSKINIYAWTGIPFELDTLTLNAQPEKGRRKANTSNVGSNILSFGDNLESVTGSRVMPNSVQNAGQVTNNAIKIGATIGSMQNAMGRSLGRSQIEALGGNWEDYKDIYEGLYPEVLTPGQIIGGDVGEGVDMLMNNQRQCASNPEPNPSSHHHADILAPGDPNDIYGYLSEAGSKFIADSVARVNYTIEFENDTTFATAAAHSIVIRDTLDSRYFDLTKFLPTGVRIGSHEVLLDNADVVTKNNVTSFVKTIDMRPEINAIAQVDGTFSSKTGIAQWTLQSLDPMTMDPTDDLMQGILPVNFNGTSGIGEVMFEVGVKQGKADGTEIKNRAGIVFDYEEAIMTPHWTNIVDAVPPTSSVTDCTMVNDSTLRIFADGFDARSGVWKYEWYVQHGENAPWWKEGETESPSFDFHFFPGFDYGLCVVVTDSAGNVEKKQIARERLFKSYGKDYEDGVPEVLEAPSTKAPADGDVYDLSGRKRSEPQENDINIINKKKVFIQRKKQ